MRAQKLSVAILTLTALVGISSKAFPQTQCGTPAHGDYVVINVKFDDPIGGLAVRDQPSSSSGRRGVIPSNGVGVEVGQCQSNGWCQVRYACLSGWALAARYLAPRSRRNYKVVGVASDDPDGLNLRAMPSHTAGISGHLRFNESSVVLHSCQPSTADQTEWCLVSGSNSGWAAGRFLATNPLASGVPSPPPITPTSPSPASPPPPAGSPPSATPEACKMFPNLC